MRTTMRIAFALALVVLTLSPAGRSGTDAQPPDPALRVGPQDMAGTVTSSVGPEAGVWVIAETTELPTKFARIVVTDDRGRYMMPDLPRAQYRVWVRGYGLIDSPEVPASPGRTLDLRAVPAPSPASAAEYYPAICWYSMLRVPEPSEFPGTGPDGNGIPPEMTSQAQWLNVVKTNGCYTCHQLGNKATRTIPPELGDFDSSVDAWRRRL